MTIIKIYDSAFKVLSKLSEGRDESIAEIIESLVFDNDSILEEAAEY